MMSAFLWVLGGLVAIVLSAIEVANGRIGFAPILLAAIFAAFHGANLIDATPARVSVDTNKGGS